MESQTLNTEATPTTNDGILDDEGRMVAKGEQMAPEKLARIQELKTTIVLDDPQSIINFGSAQQSKMTSISQEMMGGVKNKDTGAAGGLLNDMMVQVRGLDTSELKDGKSPGFFARIFGAIEPLAKFVQQYETVESQIKRIERGLEEEIMKLNRDVAMLSNLYQATVDYYHDLEFFIAAGELRLEEMDSQDIPQAKQEADASDDMMKAQRLRQLQSIYTDLERKVHDLKLTRQTVMQFLPTVSITQENDKALINKMNSSLVNTLSLWRVQIAQAIAMKNTQNAAELQKDVSDMNNDLLESNAKNLKESNAAVRKEMERGVFDIESIERANQDLISTIEESLQIAEEGREKRADAERRLVECESSLKQALRAG